MARTPSKLRAVALVGLCLLSLASVSTALRRVTPWPDEYGLRAKFEYLAANKDEFDTLFLGGSVTSYGIVPPLFDRILAERGHLTRSFNLGVGGMTTLEADHLMRRALDLEPARLRFVFFEAANWDARIWDTTNKFSDRMARWHTPEHTLIALRSIARMPVPSDKEGGPFWRFEQGCTHLALAACKFVGIGQGLRIVSALLGLDGDDLEPGRAELDELHGYLDLDRIQGEEWAARRRKFLAEQESYLERVRQVDAGNVAAASIDDHYNLEGLDSQISAIRSRSAEPVFYIGPRVFATALEYRMAEAGVLPVLFAFNQPGKYPSLYRPEVHFDLSHFTREGAEEYTRLLAEAFANHLDALRDRSGEGPDRAPRTGFRTGNR